MKLHLGPSSKRRRMRLTRLVLSEADFERLRAHLLQSDRMERAAVAVLGETCCGRTRELTVHRLRLVADEECQQQGQAVVEPTPEFVLRSFRTFAQSHLPGYLHLHSHPFDAEARFSPIDDRFLPGMIRGLQRYLNLTAEPEGEGFSAHSDPQGRYRMARLVWGRAERGFEADCFDLRGGRLGAIDEVRVAGPQGIRTLRPRARAAPADIPADARDRFDRNIRLFGADGQRALTGTRLVLCGAGGLGSYVVDYAKGLGIRRLAIIDPDHVEASNLNRLCGATHRDVGRAKVDVMARELRRYDPGIRVTPLQARVQDADAHRLIRAGDVIVNSLDDDGARLEVQQLAARHLTPLLDLGSGIHQREGQTRHMGGQAIWYWPGGPCLLCQGLDPARIVPPAIRQLQRAAGYVAGTDETPAAVVTLNAVVAGVGMELLARYLTGHGSVPGYTHIDLWRTRMGQHRFAKRSDCPICGDEGVEGRGQEHAEVMRPPETNGRTPRFGLRRLLPSRNRARRGGGRMPNGSSRVEEGADASSSR